MQDQYQALTLRLERAENRFKALGGLAVAAVAVTMLLSSRPPVAAQQNNGLPQRVAALETQVASLQTDLAQETAARAASDAAFAGQLSDLEQKTQYMSVVDGTTLFTGTNVQIVSGSGATNGPVNGLGNLIVGYNENSDANSRTGSHNLVIGQGHGYSSYGGLVAGEYNQVNGPCSSVCGGEFNITYGTDSAVSGGELNTAAGGASSVTGGFKNIAAGGSSSVSGGDYNTAAATASSVSGGAGIFESIGNEWAAGSLQSP